jgi:hypothetical protein
MTPSSVQQAIRKKSNKICHCGMPPDQCSHKSKFVNGGEYGYSLAQKEIERLKEKVTELTVSDMTHEYNDVEAERFRPEYERQLMEPLQEKISHLKSLLKIQFQKANNFQHIGAAEGEWARFEIEHGI